MLVGYRLYSGDLSAVTRWRGRLSAAHTLLANKYYIDELYNAVIIRPIHGFSKYVLWKFVDVGIIDGMVNLVGGFTRWLGGALRLTQNGVIENYAVGMVLGAAALFWWLVF
jgi:NADH-quinone oxidoreductase subunit L